MRLPDVNLLVYATNRASPQNARARAWLEARLSGTEPFVFAWASINGFIRIATRSVAASTPLTPSQAFDLVQGWLARPNVAVVDPTEGHLPLMRHLLEPIGVAGKLVPDAHLAALAIEHGATLESTDHDFGRFPGLRWEDPLLHR